MQSNKHGGGGGGGISLQYSIPSIIHKAGTDSYSYTQTLHTIQDHKWCFTCLGLSYQHTGHKWNFIWLRSQVVLYLSRAVLPAHRPQVEFHLTQVTSGALLVSGCPTSTQATSGISFDSGHKWCFTWLRLSRLQIPWGFPLRHELALNICSRWPL